MTHPWVTTSPKWHGRRKSRKAPSPAPVCEFLPFLQRYVPVLLGRVLGALVLQHVERLNQLAAGVARTNDGVKVSAFGRDVGVGEALAKLFDLGGAIGVR